MSTELSIQLQIDNIAAVQYAFSNSLTGRDIDTLWWLVDYSHNIAYENRVKGPDILNVDKNIQTVNIGSSVFGPWFNLQNSYFSSDVPITGVTNLKQAVETAYLWRASRYFNDVMLAGNSVNLDPKYVFPYPDYHLGTRHATGAATGTFTAGSGAIDLTKTGPGIIQVTTNSVIGAANFVLSLTAVYEDGTTTTLPVTVNALTGLGVSLPVGGQALTGVYTAPSSAGVVSVTSTSKFKAGMMVLLQEDLTGTTDFFWKTEIAEVANINSGTDLLLRQPTPTGSTTPFASGLRNSYTTAATVYPLFTNVTNVTNSGGTSGDEVLVGFAPDRPQAFIDIAAISYPQT